MEEKLDSCLPYFYLVFVTLIATYFLPILPKDETRYLSVAWEMYSRHSFLLPLINGSPYTHKPPMLFWLIILIWKIVGISAWPVRAIPLLFSLLSLGLVKKIAQTLWPEDKRIGERATLFLGSAFLWMIWSFLIMFDIILTFWILLAVYGLVSSIQKKKGSGILVTIGTTGGILTKGPVALLHIVIASATLYWNYLKKRKDKKKWWGYVLLSILLGTLLCSLWVVPACIKGGEAYCHRILWTQTIDRIQHSFAHKRPIWWYLPLLPAIFFPWTLYPSIWKKTIFLWREDRGTRWVISWFLLTIFCFSLISCKQIHYLLPVIPALSLAAARASGKLREGEDLPTLLLPLSLAIVGVGVTCLPLIKEISPDLGRVAPSLCLPIGMVLILAAALLFIGNKKRPEQALPLQSLVNFSLLIVGIILFKTSGFSSRFNLKQAALEAKSFQDKGEKVVFIDGYNDEFGFLGRLNKRIDIVPRSNITTFASANPTAIIVDELSPKKEKTLLFIKRSLFHTPYKNKILVMCTAKNYLMVLKK